MKIKKRTLKLAGLIVLVIIAALVVVKANQKPIYKFSGTEFSYSQNRPKPDYQMEFWSTNGTFDIYKIHYKSRDFMQYPTIIYGYLLLPKTNGKVPGVMLLPGGGVTKDAELVHAEIIARLGEAVLVIDQRGLGETGGLYLSFEDDYKAVQQGKEPVQHLSVYDALAGVDVLRSVKEVDAGKIAVAGLSMGGRYAIMAAAQDKSIKGVVGISAAGFHAPENSGNAFNDFLVSCDPDHYIGMISPNKVFLLHGSDDKKVSPQDAQYTFGLAKEPKKFYLEPGCGHGYCDAMYADLKESFQQIFSS